MVFLLIKSLYSYIIRIFVQNTHLRFFFQPTRKVTFSFELSMLNIPVKLPFSPIKLDVVSCASPSWLEENVCRKSGWRFSGWMKKSWLKKKKSFAMKIDGWGIGWDQPPTTLFHSGSWPLPEGCILKNP